MVCDTELVAHDDSAVSEKKIHFMLAPGPLENGFIDFVYAYPVTIVRLPVCRRKDSIYASYHVKVSHAGKGTCHARNGG